MKQKITQNAVLVNIGWMLFDKVFLLLLNLLVTVRVANYFGSYQFGKYQYAVSIAAVFEVFVNGMDGRIVKKNYLHLKPEEVVWNATVSRAGLSVVSFGLGICFLLFGKKGGQLNGMLFFLLLAMVLNSLRFGMANRFEYDLRSKKIVIASDLAVTFSGFLQLAAVRFQWDILSVAVIAFFSAAWNLVILYIQYRQEYQTRLYRRINLALVKQMAIESTPLAVAASCAVIYQRCDSIMLEAFMTAREVGIYAISLKLVNVMQIIVVPVRESVFPKLIGLYHTNRKEYEAYYVRVTAVLTWMYFAAVAVSITVLPLFFRFLSDSYAQAYPVFQIQAVGTFFMFNAALRAGHFTLINHGAVLMWSQLVSVVVNILLNFVGIRYFGMYGAAAATACTQCISLFLSNLFFKDGREVFLWQLKAFNPYYIFAGRRKKSW